MDGYCKTAAKGSKAPAEELPCLELSKPTTTLLDLSRYLKFWSHWHPEFSAPNRTQDESDEEVGGPEARTIDRRRRGKRCR